MEKYAGPIRRHTTSSIKATRCIDCRRELTMEEVALNSWWCWTCKDQKGYIERLRRASAGAKARCAEAYPHRESEQLTLFSPGPYTPGK